MLQVPNKRLPATAQQKLREFQNDVNTSATYAERVRLAKTQFRARNKSSDPTFAAVRSKLTEMCRGARRCMYCDDSFADEVEHFKPKDLYPELVFVWANYLYACGPCNGPKNNRFSIIDATGQLIDASRPRDAAVTPPPLGEPALIDPRREDPLAFMMLDLRDTFQFAPTATVGTIGFARAEYTIGVLRLNERDYLVHARENFFGAFRARLREYVTVRNTGATVAKLARLKTGLQRSPHPTVWAEMKRQHMHHPELRDLFTQAPEALSW